MEGSMRGERSERPSLHINAVAKTTRHGALRGGAAVDGYLFRGEMVHVSPQDHAPRACAESEQVHARIDERHRARRPVIEAMRGAVERIEHQAVRDDYHLLAA